MSFGAAIQAMIGADVSGLQAGGPKVEAVAGQMNSALGKIGLGLSLAAVTGFFSSVIQKAGAIQDLSDKLGVGTDALQAFQFRAMQAGATANDVAMMWDKSRKSIDQLAAGEAAAEKVFARLHLTQKDLLGLPLEQQVERIARAYQAAKGEAGAYDAVTDILGSKTAPRLMQVLGELAGEGLPAFTQSAKDAGQVIDEETIPKLDELGDRAAALMGRLVPLGASILSFLLKATDGLGILAAAAVNAYDGIATSVNRADFEGKKAVRTIEAQAGALEKVVGASEKVKKAAAEKRAADEAELRGLNEIYRNQEKRVAAAQALADFERTAAQERMSTEQRLISLGEDQARLAGEIAAFEDFRAQQGELTAEGAQKLLSLKQQQLAVESQIAAEAERAARAAAAAAASAAARAAFAGNISREGRGDEDMSDAELERKLRTLREDIARREINERAQGAWAGQNYRDPLLNAIQRPELLRLEQELELRRDTRREAGFFGADRAFQMSDLTESRFNEILRGLTDNEKIVKVLEDISNKQSAGLVRIAETLRGGGG